MECPSCHQAQLVFTHSSTGHCPACNAVFHIAGRPPDSPPPPQASTAASVSWDSVAPSAGFSRIRRSQPPSFFNRVTLNYDDDPELADAEEVEIPFEEPPLPTYNPDPNETGGLVLPDLTLPTGWRWLQDPDTQAGYVVIDERHVTWDGPAQSGCATYAERLSGLKDWVTSNGLKAKAHRNRDDIQLHEDPVAQTGWTLRVTAPFQFLVCTARYWNYNYGSTDWVAAQSNTPRCRLCRGRHPVGTLRCPSTGMPTYCPTCGRTDRFDVQWSEALTTWWCSSCAYSCAECGNSTPQGFDYCSDCRTLGRCTNCRATEYLAAGDVSTILDGLCTACHARRCPQCSNIDRHSLQWSPVHEQWLCRGCWRGSLSNLHEEEPEGDDDVQTILSIPGRENIRMCGIELEGANGVGGDGRTLSRELYREGLSQHAEMQGYHHGSTSFIHVEADSSVDWEVVMGPLNPADDDQMLAVNRAMRLIRGGIHAGRYKLDLRCGLHIHVGAEGFGLGQAYNLNTLFSYVEDVMFRLAAAKWPIHRSMTGSPYCGAVTKSTSKLAFGREVGQNESRDARRVALNFRNYFQRMLNNCSCGAVRFDSWENCTCDLGKCTFEFRLFNSTANPRKLHAYMALAQALVAKAGSIPEIENPQDDFPPQTFLAKPFKAMTEEEQVQATTDWVPRLRWLLHELPLTDDERASILYCARNSDLAVLGEEALNELAIPTIEEVTA